MVDEYVSYRELEALLDPLVEGQNRIEKKVDSLVSHKDAVSERIQSVEIRLSVLESKKVNWPVIMVIIGSVLAWLLTHLRWG